MQWTDRIRQVKIILVLAAIVIAVTSLLISHYLAKDLSKEEHKKMEVWAQALHMLNHADETTDLTLVLDVIQGNTTIPIIVLNSEGGIDDFRNIEDTTRLERYAQEMLQSGDTIHVGDQLVCYDESVLLKRLSQYPYWQLGIVMVFVVVAIFALLSSKKAEQNKVWVGLSKETAHQLGTPISSLMAWVEILKENHPNDELIPELDKDVKRLERIAERFSKIGSKVEITCHMPDHEVTIKMNESLVEWVIENLCKNAVDAMEGKGKIILTLTVERNLAVIEVSDNGKGIRKKDIKHVFTPGFTTKQRGWGLGLSLARRIVEDYHKGKIFVKSSELGKGTIFRVEL